MATKFGQKYTKMHRFQFCTKNEDVSTRIVRFSESANLNMLSEILRESTELPGNQIWTKISQNSTNYNSVQKIKQFFGYGKVYRVGEYTTWSNVYLNFQGSQGCCHGNQN